MLWVSEKRYAHLYTEGILVHPVYTVCHFLLLEGFVLLLEGPDERGDGRPLVLELGLLALELGLLTLKLGLLLLKRCSSLPQLGLAFLGLLGLLVSHGSLSIALTGSSGQFLLQLVDAPLQGCHLVGPSVGLFQSRDQGGIVQIEPMHPGVQPCHPVALVLRHGQQLLQMGKHVRKHVRKMYL
jgi:hypothetical protein